MLMSKDEALMLLKDWFERDLLLVFRIAPTDGQWQFAGEGRILQLDDEGSVHFGSESMRIEIDLTDLPIGFAAHDDPSTPARHVVMIALNIETELLLEILEPKEGAPPLFGSAGLT